MFTKLIPPVVKASWFSPPVSLPPSSPLRPPLIMRPLYLEKKLPPHLLGLGYDRPPVGLREGAEEEMACRSRQQLLYQHAAFTPPEFQSWKLLKNLKTPTSARRPSPWPPPPWRPGQRERPGRGERPCGISIICLIKYCESDWDWDTSCQYKGKKY